MTKKEALKYIYALPADAEVEVTVTNRIATSGELEQMGISRQLLRYYVKEGYVRTIPHGKQKRYLLDDVLKVRGGK